MGPENYTTNVSLLNMNWIELPDNQRRTIVDAVLMDNPRMNENVIEKDWWVTLILKALFSSSCKEFLTFKGGTSLAKWGIIDRFSEDVDVALDKSMWGLVGDTNTQRDNIRKRTRKFIGGSLVSELKNQLKEMGTKDFDIEFVESKDSDKDPTVVVVPYRSLYSSVGYVPAAIKVEFSSRSLLEPRVPLRIVPLFAKTYPEVFSDYCFDVMAVHPSRTFMEKIFLLHEELQKDHPRTLRMTRHLYDISQLMETEYAKSALEDTQMYLDIVKHRSVFNSVRGIDYSKHHPSLVDIIPKGDLAESWRNDYALMREHFIYGESLDYDTLIEKLKGLQNRIRAIKIDKELFNFTSS